MAHTIGSIFKKEDKKTEKKQHDLSLFNYSKPRLVSCDNACYCCLKTVLGKIVQQCNTFVEILLEMFFFLYYLKPKAFVCAVSMNVFVHN